MRSLKHQSPHRARRRAGSKNHARRLDPVSQASCVVSSRRNCSKRQHQIQIELQNLNRHYDSNQQYSITAVSDGGGTVVERYAYSAYGQVTIADASGAVISDTAIANRYTYTGREWDEGLSLYHYRARMYDAVGGRFVSRDPIGFTGSRFGLYEYVSGSPTLAVDPSGLYGGWGGNTYTSPPPTPGTGHYTIGGWWRNLSPIKEYVYYHCAQKCNCVYFRDLATTVESTADEAIESVLSLEFNPNEYPSVFDVPRDFLPPDLIESGHPLPTFPASLSYTGRAHSALRHCIWSGLLAKRIADCKCAACIIDARDMFQYFYGEGAGPQSVSATQQAIYNDREGRSCAGCLGNYAAGTPGESVGYPFLPGETNIVSCCTQKLLSGRLATSNNRPGPFPQMPPRPSNGSPPSHHPPIFPWPGVF